MQIDPKNGKFTYLYRKNLNIKQTLQRVRLTGIIWQNILLKLHVRFRKYQIWLRKIPFIPQRRSLRI